MQVKIGFDATAAVHQSAGIGRYTGHLLEALARREGDERFSVCYCGRGARAGGLPRLNGRFSVHRIPASDRTMNAIWHRARFPLPVQLFTGPIDLFHSPDFTLPPVPGTPTVLTVHDLAFLTVPECAVPSLRDYLAKVVPRSARRATRVIAVSESTRRDVINLLGVSPQRVVTVLEAPSRKLGPVHDPERARSRLSALGIAEPFVLTVGTLEPRKNYPRLFEAFARLRDRGLPHRLVVAGARGWMYEPALRRVSELRLESQVTFVRPTDDELVLLYGCADAFVYPSLYEGFGLPPIEAMASGTPVACSITSSLPEVVGDAGVLFDPTDIDAMADAIRSILEDEELRSRLKTAGISQAARFSWERTAENTIGVYRQAVDA